MLAMEKELPEHRKATADALKRKKANVAGTVSPDADTGDDPMAASNSVARNLPTTTRRGRPGPKRKKGGLQLQPSRPTFCSVCKEKDHDARNCPVRLADPERYLLLSLFN